MCMVGKIRGLSPDPFSAKVDVIDPDEKRNQTTPVTFFGDRTEQSSTYLSSGRLWQTSTTTVVVVYDHTVFIQKQIHKYISIVRL